MDKLPKVELHVHLDGACNPTMLRNMCIKDKLDESRFHYSDEQEFEKVVCLLEPQQSLVDFLKPFPEICHILSTRDNLIQQSVEFCQFQANNNVLYTEVRYCPPLFTSRGGLTNEEALLAIIEGLNEGQLKYKIKVKSILSFLRQFPEWSMEIADLAIKHKSKGIVGVDIAGDELKPMNQEHIDAFQKCHDAGIYITVHAAESGPPSNIMEAINDLHAIRIGHGYRVLDDSDVYKFAKDKNIHFETCLTSSIYTNSSCYKSHTIKTFASDKVNYGLNTDDPGLIKTTLNKEFVSAQTDILLTEQQIIDTVYNAAKSSFLPENEKKQLIEEIDKQIEQYKNSN